MHTETGNKIGIMVLNQSFPRFLEASSIANLGRWVADPDAPFLLGALEAS